MSRPQRRPHSIHFALGTVCRARRGGPIVSTLLRPRQESRWGDGGPLRGPPRRCWSLYYYFLNTLVPRSQPLSSFRAGGEGLGDQHRLNAQWRVPRPPTLVAPLRGATRGAREGAVTLAQGASSLLHFKKGF